MKRTFLAAAAVILTCSFGLAAEERSGWVDRELEKIQESARFDFPAYTQWFYLRSAFAEHPEGEAIGKGANQHYQELADAIAAEVWSTASPGSPIGWTPWISELTVLKKGVAIPELFSTGQGEARLMFAVGPGKDDGGIDVERTGTAYWVYE